MTPTQPLVDTGLPLAGITVVTVEQAVAAPLATRHMADLGARVIKVEAPDGGDFARTTTPVWRTGPPFVWLNRGKDRHARPEVARRTADPHRLIVTADVFVQNLAPGAAARLGFGAAELRARHPRLVTVDMSGYGGRAPTGTSEPTTC